MAEKRVFKNFDELYKHLRGKEKPIVPVEFKPAKKKKAKKKEDEVQAD